MQPIIIGSFGLQHALLEAGLTKEAYSIKPKDVDIICRDKTQAEAEVKRLMELARSSKTQLKYIKTISTPKFSTKTVILFNQTSQMYYELTYPVSGLRCTTAQLFENERWSKLDLDGAYRIPTIDVLLALKMSHRFLKDSPHFIKTMQSIHFMRPFANTVDVELYEWQERRQAETLNYESYSLKKTSQEFFNSNFDYIYDHDSIHEAVKHLDRPAYTMYMTHGEQVHCSAETFHSLPKSIRLMGVIEEAMVLALERSQIPFNFEPDERKSFMMALEKVCTSITSGWFREFAWENFFVAAEIADSMIPGGYVNAFQTALDQGRIKPYGGTK